MVLCLGRLSRQSTTTAVVTGVGELDSTHYVNGTKERDTVTLSYKQSANQLQVDAPLNQICSSAGTDGGSDGGSDHNSGNTAKQVL